MALAIGRQRGSLEAPAWIALANGRQRGTLEASAWIALASEGIWSPLLDHRKPPAGIGCPSSGHGRPPYWAAGCGMQGSRLLGSRMQGRGMEGSGK